MCDATDRSRGFSLGGEVPTLVLTVRKNTPADDAGLRCARGDFILLQVGCYHDNCMHYMHRYISGKFLMFLNSLSTLILQQLGSSDIPLA